jgi:hypothetical protein
MAQERASLHPLGQLQGALGNRAFGRFIQSQLKVSPPGETHEQVAQALADFNDPTTVRFRGFSLAAPRPARYVDRSEEQGSVRAGPGRCPGEDLEGGQDEREAFDQVQDETVVAESRNDRPHECSCNAAKTSDDETRSATEEPRLQARENTDAACACGKSPSPASHEHPSPPTRAREAGWFTADSSATRPREAGWFTGNWYLTSNTIICDGGGDFTINEATNYEHGVQECSRKHEQSHMGDWRARYGNEICKGRAKGDLPNFVPAGKESYADFLKKSECTAWTVGETCRKEKLVACDSLDTDDKKTTCKAYVQPHVEFAGKQVKKYC